MPQPRRSVSGSEAALAIAKQLNFEGARAFANIDRLLRAAGRRSD
jgi:hypothetical protein